MLIMIPMPEDYVETLADLCRHVWEGIDSDAYIQAVLPAVQLSCLPVRESTHQMRCR